MADLLGPASAANATATRPSDTRVFGSDDTWFKSCTDPQIDDGTDIEDNWLNGILAQVRRAIRGMGVTVDNADDDMLLKAIQSSGIPYLVDSGAANALVVTSPVPITAYAAGQCFLCKAANDVTAAATINRDGAGAKNIKHADGTALARGDWPAGGIGLLAYDGTQFQLLTVMYSQQAQQYGQCYLSLSGGNLVLKPKDGRFLFINGSYRPIPVAGVSLAPSGLTANTLYYIYAAWSGGTMSLEASATGHATDATTGAEIKSGDATRSLVGMAYVLTGPAFSDALVLSWFNRKAKRSRTAFTASRSTTSLSMVEINAEIRNVFLTWGDELVEFAAIGQAFSSPGQTVWTGVGFDGTTPEPEISGGGNGYFAGGANGNTAVAAIGRKQGLAEGYHYATVLGAANSGSGWGQWPFAAAGGSYGATAQATTLTITVKG